MKPNSLTSVRRLSAYLSDYGIAVVLLVLIVAFSILTLEHQSSTGADAGRAVAARIFTQHGSASDVVVVIIAGNKPGDDQFAASATESCESAGLSVAATVQGTPRDARQTIEGLLNSGASITAIATTGEAATWTIYAAIQGISRDQLFVAEPGLWPTFARMDNILSVANQTAIYAIIAIGMTLVIITAGIDLSVGSLVALSAVAAAVFIRDYAGGDQANAGFMLLGCVLGIGLCAVAGIFNGLMVTTFRIPPFIATLAMMLMARGGARRLSEELSIIQLPDSYKWIGGSSTAGIPNPVLLMLCLYVVAHLLMTRTIFGRYVYAVGGNREAARLSGVPVKTILIIVYTVCGAMAGLGGIIQSSKFASGDPKYGLMLELDVIAAVVVGGTSLMGGEGRIFGTLVGAFIIAVIKNGMNLMKVGAPEQQIVLGAVILLAVLVDTMKHKSASA